MFSDFILYAKTGFEHILDPQGYDHILFVLALCVMYEPKDWKKLLYLVTAFTLGHSVTLACATLKIISIESRLIEALIPLTIFVTCAANFLQAPPYHMMQAASKATAPNSVLWRYIATLFFGFIHGLGFSNFLVSLLGNSAQLALPLFAFNVGLEVGQLLVVLTCLVLAGLTRAMHINRRDWILILSGLVGGIALKLLMERL
jgi:hypothetical protein